KGRTLYAVGGVWRTLARVDMEQEDYPLRVLHSYAIPANRAKKLCKLISGQSRKSLEKIHAVPRRRAEALPYGALVMESLLDAAEFDAVVVSAYRLREGVHYRNLSDDEAAKDPLIEYAADYNVRESRNASLTRELFAWMAPLFTKESPESRRIREAACL